MTAAINGEGTNNVTASQTVHRLTRTDLARMSDADLTRSHVAINSILTEWDASNTVRPAHLRFTLTSILNEMIARRILAEHPSAATVAVRSDDVTYCREPDGSAPSWCTGHPAGMRASAILDAAGDVLGVVDPYSPVQYWIERSAMDSALSAYFLDVRTREMHVPEGF